MYHESPLMKIFSIKKLTNALNSLLYIDFAYIFGSSQDGKIDDNSDLDIAVYISKQHITDFETIAKILEAIDNNTPAVECDLCHLNTASAILCFEALKGKLLFIRPESNEQFSAFYSKTCREFEDYSFWMKKQLEYRGLKL